MTPLQKFLSDCRQVESKATKGPWLIGYEDSSGGYNEDENKFCISSKNEPVFHGKYSENGSDAEFIAFSRNNFLKLVECVEVLSEVCEDTAKWDNPYTIGIACRLIHGAKEAIEKVEGILDGKP